MTPDGPPPISRRAVRVILVRPDERILLICGEDPATSRRVWVMPGGGIEDGETIHEAAARELREETGIDVDAGGLAGPVWTREHEFTWDSRAYAYEEWFVVARLSTEPVVVPFPGTPGEAAGMVAMEWASATELLEWPDALAPRRLPELLPAILAGELPAEPIPTGT
jgi:8-oxo-dGTP pyrophosphatase MutT (NUDIX family)